LFKRILFPTDFSAYAQSVFGCITDLRGVGEVILLNITDSRMHVSAGIESYTGRAKAELAKLEKLLEKRGVSVRSLVKVGVPAQEIAKTADEVDASLVLMGARGIGLFREMFLGSTTADVMRHSQRPLLIVRFKLVKKLGKIMCERVCQDLLSRILFATDFSEPSLRAIALLKRLKEYGARQIVLVHVIDRGETKEEARTLREAAEKELKGMKDEYRAEGWQVKTVTAEGVASKKIMSLAKTENASLIVVGARGRGLIERLLVGSTAENIARRADRPVLVLR
jgi:nucleotide-binding universal stress UspA family protein